MSGGFAEPLDHDPLVRLFDDVWFVRAVLPVGPMLSVPRTMTVVEGSDGLVVINAIRLSTEGQDLLAQLGPVRHVVRLGQAGRDDGWYRHHHGAQLWALPAEQHEPGAPPDRTLAPDTLPLADAQLFVFQTAAEVGRPEACLRLRRHGGMLVSGDSLQDPAWIERGPVLARWALQRLGFAGGMLCRPWLQGVEARPAQLRDDLERLLALEFRHLLPGYGLPVLDTAHDEIHASVREQLG